MFAVVRYVGASRVIGSSIIGFTSYDEAAGWILIHRPDLHEDDNEDFVTSEGYPVCSISWGCEKTPRTLKT